MEACYEHLSYVDRLAIDEAPFALLDEQVEVLPGDAIVAPQSLIQNYPS